MSAEDAITAAVLAAGTGSRIGATPDFPKPLHLLHGEPLIEHVLRSVAHAGVQCAAVAVRSEHRTLAQYLKTRRAPPKVTLVCADTAGGYETLLAVRPVLAPDFLLCTADSVFPPNELRAFLSPSGEEHADMTITIVKRDPDAVGQVGVMLEGQLVRDISKELLGTEWVSEGPMWCTAAAFVPELLTAAVGVTSLSDFQRLLLRLDRPLNFRTMSWAMDVDTHEDLRRAERRLERGRQPQ